MILADKIINLRKKFGWSQEELADKLNVSRQAVSKWESSCNSFRASTGVLRQRYTLESAFTQTVGTDPGSYGLWREFCLQQ